MELVIVERRQFTNTRLAQRFQFPLDDVFDCRVIHGIVSMAENIAQPTDATPWNLGLAFLTVSRVLMSSSVPRTAPFRSERTRSMLPMISRSRSIGTSEGIDGLCLRAWTRKRPEPVAMRDSYVSEDDYQSLVYCI